MTTNKELLLTDEEWVKLITENPNANWDDVAQAQLDKAVAHYEPLIEQARQEGGRQIVDRFENWAAELSLDDTVTTLPISKIIEFLEQELRGDK